MFDPVLALVVRKPLPIVLLMLDLFMSHQVSHRALRRWALHGSHEKTGDAHGVSHCVCTVAHHNDHKTIDGEAVPCAV